MDFLDPKKKKYRSIRLLIGHSLMIILVATGTLILVYQAYGFHFDRQTGSVIQNGLVFVDSQPQGSTIRINGQTNEKNTDAKLALPEGQYTFEVTKSGYRSWKRLINLDGGEVLRMSYPLLIPTELKSESIEKFNNDMMLATQSPDRRFVIVWEKGKINSATLFDLNKKTKDKPAIATLNFPSNLFSPGKGLHNLKVVEWSNDNKRLLIQHQWSKGGEYIMIDREKPGESFNINDTFNVKFTSVSLKDKKFDKLYLFDSVKNRLLEADAKRRTHTPVAENVISYKPLGEKIILMGITNSSDRNKLDIVLRDDGKDYLLRTIPASKNLKLDVREFDNDLYAVVGVEADKRVYVYKNPTKLLAGGLSTDIASIIILKTPGKIDNMSFSENSRFIMVRSGQNISTYDAEYKELFSYNARNKIDKGTHVNWIDGYRIGMYSSGKLYIFDFDGINKRTLVSAETASVPFFNKDYSEMYTFTPNNKKQPKPSLVVTHLRLPDDR